MNARQVHSQLQDGLALHAKGRLADAAQVFARVRTAAPREFDGWNLGGLVALQLGKAAEAVAFLKRAMALRPGQPQTAMNLAIAHVAAGEPAAAEALLLEIARQQPGVPDAWRYLGLVYETQGRIADAAHVREKVVSLAPQSGPAWIDYGSTLSLLSRQTDALHCFRQALSLEPANLRARVGCAMVFLRCHRVLEAVRELEQVLQSAPSDLLARSFRLMALNYLSGFSREQLVAEHRAFGQLLGPPTHHSWTNAIDPDRRLRVGFVSRDLREHSVAYFLEPLLAHLGANGCDVVLYDDNTRHDATAERLRRLAVAWRPVAGLADPALEARVREDQIDVLVDLAGHTAANRLALFARRIAPVQVTYLGYPNTTGVAAMDFRFVDDFTDPDPSANAWTTERLVRFSSVAWAYAPPVDAPAVSAPPCTGAGVITFGSFNNFGKVTDEVLRLWSQILARCPGSRLLIKAGGVEEPAVADPLRQRLRAAGIPDGRVQVLPHTPDTRSHLAQYAQVDIGLDTFPYNGTTTTCEALWMGVPVVTCIGDRHAARVGGSLLKAIGRESWAASSPEQYVAVAAALAADRDRLGAIRAGLRAEVAASPLLDHAGQAARFAAALRQCWRDWCLRASSPTR